MLSLKECYDILGIDGNADLEALKRAYRRKAFELHPDLNPNDPAASRKFQQVNEAYVALSSVLKSSGPAQENGAQKNAEASASTHAEKNGTGTFSEQRRREAHKAYAQQDVLRDLLNDPFARRVFEDIYSELNRKQAQDEPRRDAPPQTEKIRPQPEEKKNTKIFKNATSAILADAASEAGKGVSGAVKGWLRRQIDDEQTLHLPANGLVPGRHVRLQIRRGLSDEVQTVEITLPRDFVPGKPLRLKGLGKRVGPWEGDLYLTIHADRRPPGSA